MYYDFNQKVHLRRDPSQYGRIGCGSNGDRYDLETGVQLVFWEHEGCDIVTPELASDLMSEEELRERRRLFFGVMRRPEMRVLRLALRHIRDDAGLDWREIQSAGIDHTLPDLWLLVTDKYEVYTHDPRNPKLDYEDFALLYLHETDNPDCKCVMCKEYAVFDDGSPFHAENADGKRLV